VTFNDISLVGARWRPTPAPYGTWRRWRSTTSPRLARVGDPPPRRTVRGGGGVQRRLIGCPQLAFCRRIASTDFAISLSSAMWCGHIL